MNVSKYLPQPILLINAIALPTVSSLITLALFIDLECFPAYAIPNSAIWIEYKDERRSHSLRSRWAEVKCI